MLLTSVMCNLQQAISSSLLIEHQMRMDVAKGCEFTTNSCYSPGESESSRCQQ